jgi:hypothetical protein
MPLLKPEQQRRALEAFHEYLVAPPNPDGRRPMEVQAELDCNRERLIEAELKPLVTNYLKGQVTLTDFKSKVDGLNKRNEYWGFKGIKGQMFFNLLVNVSEDVSECDGELKAALAIPASEEMARSRLKTFISYVKRMREQHIESGGSKQGAPKLSSIPYFLSYFWQIQNHNVWPIYYTNSVQMMVDLNLWQPTTDLAEDYITYKHLYEELVGLFAQDTGKSINLYQVEHVFWWKGGNPYGGHKPLPQIGDGDGEQETGSIQVVAKPEAILLPDSYIPPIIAILPRMAINDPALVEAAKASGISLDRAFEKNINAAYTILGYDAKLMGQGQGRVPDGLALDLDDSYALLWDAKVRANGYSMGTDDRTIREYITSQSRELKRKKSLRNIYYIIVSSGFKDDYDDSVRSLKMETDISEVILVETEALVAMVDAKLRDPRVVSLGSDGLQRLFSVSGILTADDVRETLA